MTPWTAESVERTFREVAQLRALARRLPRMPTPRRERLAAEFERFAATGSEAGCSPEALAHGLEALWEAGQAERILELAGSYRGEWTLDATTFLELARASAGRGRR